MLRCIEYYSHVGNLPTLGKIHPHEPPPTNPSPTSLSRLITILSSGMGINEYLESRDVTHADVAPFLLIHTFLVSGAVIAS